MKNWLLYPAFFISLAVLCYSQWRWSTCGYDCGIISISSGPAAIVAWWLSAFVLAVTSLILLVLFLVARVRGGSTD